MSNESDRTIFDVARYIFDSWQRPYITQIELYKLLWFCQGWYIAGKGDPLFSEKFEAHKFGPVPVDLWNIFKGIPRLFKKDFDTLIKGDPEKVTGDAKTIVDLVLKHYGEYSQAILIYLSHKGEPWEKNHSKRDKTIPLVEIKEYFSQFKTAE